MINRSRTELITLILAAVIAPFIFPEFKTQLAFLWVFILFALTWDLQGGQMGYNSFGNIVFFGLGMYIATVVQIALSFNLSEWTEAGGEKHLLIMCRNFCGFCRWDNCRGGNSRTGGIAAGAVSAGYAGAIFCHLHFGLRHRGGRNCFQHRDYWRRQRHVGAGVAR